MKDLQAEDLEHDTMVLMHENYDEAVSKYGLKMALAHADPRIYSDYVESFEVIGRAKIPDNSCGNVIYALLNQFPDSMTVSFFLGISPLFLELFLAGQKQDDSVARGLRWHSSLLAPISQKLNGRLLGSGTLQHFEVLQ